MATPSGPDYVSSTQVRIKSLDYPDEVVYVDNISLGKNITVTKPVGSAAFREGQNPAITWDRNYTGGNVNIELYKSLSYHSTIASLVSNTGSYTSWEIPSGLTIASDYTIKISDGTVSDFSDPFTIEGIDTTQSVLVVRYNEYDQYGNISEAEEGNGPVVRYKYGDEGRNLIKISQIGPDTLSTYGSYDNLGQLTTLINPSGVIKTFHYDGLGRLKTVKNNTGQTVSEHTYTLQGSSLSAADPNWILTQQYTGSDIHHATKYFDGFGRTIQTQQEGSDSTIVSTVEYDAQGREWRSWKPYKSGSAGYDQDFAGADTVAYDHPYPYREQLYEASPLDRPVKTIPEGGETSAGAVTTEYEVRPWTNNGKTHNYLVTTTTDEAGNKTETWTDGWGRDVSTVAAPGTADEAITEFIYDELDQLVEVRHPNDFDSSLSGTFRTTYDYDTRGNLVEKTSPDAGTVRYKYDAAGNLRFSQDAVQAAAGEVSYIQYDELGRRLAEGIASATFSDIKKDSSYATDANKHGVYAYDSKPASGSLPWKQFGTQIDSATLSNTTGQLTARAWHVDDGSGSVIGANPWQLELMSYDSEGRVSDKWIYTGDKDQWNTHLAYEYNRQGEITRRTVTIGSETIHQHYTYNQRGLLENVYLSDDGTVDSEPAEVTYSYTPDGTVDKITYRNSSTIVTNDYDIRGRLTGVNDIDSTSSSPFATQYEYKKNSSLDRASFWNPNITTNLNLSSDHRTFTYDYSYDKLNRLEAADYQLAGTNPAAFDVPLVTYDGAGNIDLLQRRDQSGSLVDDLDYSYPGGTNRLSSITDNAGFSQSWDPKTGSFSYDANGNLTSMTGYPDLSNVTYDHRNLPVQLDLPDSTQQINSYNAAGQRILKEVQTSSGTAWSFYILDGYSTLGVIQGGELQYLNIMGNNVAGRVVADIGAITADNAKRYYIKDLTGSTRAVVNENGATTENRDYYPFGLLMDERQYVQGDETTEKFTGKERDQQTGFDYFGARYYMSGIGRFVTVDPLADQFPGWSPYNYAYNNPLSYVDPTGMSPVCVEKENCDETYSEGSVVSNRLGEWKYLGDNQWETVSLADGVDEIKSGLGYAYHRFDNIAGYDYHDFGDRTLAERTLNIADHSSSLEWIGGPRTAAVKGLRSLSSLFKSGRVDIGSSRTIYRAVSKAELDDIAKFGLRNKSGGYETGKLFSPTLEEAAKFGRNNFMFDKIPNHIIKVKVPNDVLRNAYRFQADGMNAISIPANQLHRLRATPLNYSPLIR